VSVAAVVINAWMFTWRTIYLIDSNPVANQLHHHHDSNPHW
jgi:hypothetical protein